MARRKSKRQNSRLKKGLSPGQPRSSRNRPKQSSPNEHEAETEVDKTQVDGDPADILAGDLLASVQQVAPSLPAKDTEGQRHSLVQDDSTTTEVAALKYQHHESGVDHLNAYDIESDEQQTQLQRRTASRCVPFDFCLVKNVL